MERSPHLTLAKKLWQQFLRPGDGVIDATCGNGHDTLFLASLPLSFLYALDIQDKAIEQTRRRLEQILSAQERAKVTLLCMSHEDLCKIPDRAHSPRLIVYNLGYLPGGDKTLTTRTESTLRSVASALTLAAPGGALSITCYPGHPEGKKEKQTLLEFCSHLDSSQWTFSHHQWEGRDHSPSLLWIERQTT